MVRIENKGHMRDITFKVTAFSALTRLKPLKLGLFGMKLSTKHYLLYIIVFQWLQFKTRVIRLILCWKLCF